MSKRIIRDGRGLEIPERQIAEQLSNCGLNERAFYAATKAILDTDVMHFLCVYERAKGWYEKKAQEQYHETQRALLGLDTAPDSVQGEQKWLRS